MRSCGRCWQAGAREDYAGRVRGRYQPQGGIGKAEIGDEQQVIDQLYILTRTHIAETDDETRKRFEHGACLVERVQRFRVAIGSAPSDYYVRSLAGTSHEEAKAMPLLARWPGLLARKVEQADGHAISPWATG